jgi:hypothetical protein
VIRLLTLLALAVTLGIVVQLAWTQLDRRQRPALVVGAVVTLLILAGLWLIIGSG